MKKTKRMLALVLAMMMAFAIMAMTASAYEAEDGHVHTEACSEEGSVQRRPPAGRCPICGVWGTYDRIEINGVKKDHYHECGHVVPVG